ncbi:hypothetical protein ACKWTF_000401 [Chironomus riparius]
MIFLKYLIILSLIGCAFSGGTSTCSRLREIFVELLSASQNMLERLANQTVENSVAYKAIENSFVSELLCNLDVVVEILAEGTSQASNINASFIAEILRGNNDSEFPFPLSCIKKEMLSFITIVDYILQNTYSTLSSVSYKSPVNFNSSCESVVQHVSSYYHALSSYIDSRIFTNLADAVDFKNIGQFDLYLKFHVSINKCMMTTLAKSVAELLNSDENTTIEFTTNQSIELPSPLNCVSGLFGSAIAQIELGYIEFSKTVFNLQHPEACLQLGTDFGIFVDIWSGYVDKLQNFAIENILKYPVLTSSFISDFECEAHRMLIFAANATSHISGVSFDASFSILNNPIIPPFGLPLDCIADDLIYIRNYIWTIIKSIAPGLKVFKLASIGNFDSCSEVLATFADYVSPLMLLISSREAITSNAAKEFESIKIHDQFQASLVSNGECLPSFLASYISSVLNASSINLPAYLNGTSDDLAYPFSCVRLMIDTLRNMSNHTLTEYRAGVMDASIPEIKDLFG